VRGTSGGEKKLKGEGVGGTWLRTKGQSRLMSSAESELKKGSRTEPTLWVTRPSPSVCEKTVGGKKKKKVTQSDWSAATRGWGYLRIGEKGRVRAARGGGSVGARR